MCAQTKSLVAAVVLGACGVASGQVTYQYDDGVGSGNIGPSAALTPADFMWGQVYTTQPGGERITTISVAFGTTLTAGRPTRVYLFSDPTPDGDPRDAVLLTSVDGVTPTPQPNVFVDFAITPTVVSGDFFVAASVFFQASGERPARYDAGGVAQADRAWLFAGPSLSSAGALNATAAPYAQRMNAFFTPGVFMIRATGTPVPSCYANCDGSTSEPVLNAIDFSCFLGRYVAAQGLPAGQQASEYANCDGSTNAPVLNALDFSCFLGRYRAGCR